MIKPGYKILFIFLLFISLMWACKKTNTPQPVVTLNQTETQLLGKWYVWKQLDTQLYYIGTNLSSDTNKTYFKTYKNFTAANYIEFRSAAYISPTVPQEVLACSALTVPTACLRHLRSHLPPDHMTALFGSMTMSI